MDSHLSAIPPTHYYLIAMTLACAVTDARTGRIYNAVTLPSIALGLAYHALAGSRPELVVSLAGLAAGLFPFSLAAWRGWMGWGDVKLFGAVGAVAGVFVLLDVVLASFLLASVWGLAVLWRRGGAGGVARRFGAGLRMVFTGRRADGDDDRGPELRLGVFVFLGTVVAIAAAWAA